MKKGFFVFVIASGTICLAACRRDDVGENSVYLTAAETNVKTTLSVDSIGGSFAISAKSSQLAPSDVPVILSIDTSLLAEFNQRNATGYSPLPAGSYELSTDTLSLAKGTNISSIGSFKVLSIKNFKPGVSYMIPVTIKTAGLPVLNAARTLFIAVKKVIISSVASITNNYFTMDFSKNVDSLKAMKNLSFEIRTKVYSNFTDHPSILMGVENEFQPGFAAGADAKLQVIKVKGTFTRLGDGTPLGVWRHYAITYDGSDMKIYVDGELQASAAETLPVDLTAANFCIGRSAGSAFAKWNVDGEISEARVWSKALTQAEIKSGMCAVDPASPNLVAYWKFNAAAGTTGTEAKTVIDLSGNGHNATANTTIVWVPKVRCE